jgi:hypothetical protein
MHVCHIDGCADVTAGCADDRRVKCALAPALQVGGLLLVAPEQRLSLQLKSRELALQGSEAGAAVVEQLTALARLPYLDVMDESDELLHHR